MAVLGELEMQVMRQLWAAPNPVTVRDIFEALNQRRELAYTTVMTVLDRLAKKHVVLREQEGRAWLYRPAMGQAELVAGELVSVLAEADEHTDEALRLFASELSAEQRAVLSGAASATAQ